MATLRMGVGPEEAALGCSTAERTGTTFFILNLCRAHALISLIKVSPLGGSALERMLFNISLDLYSCGGLQDI